MKHMKTISSPRLADDKLLLLGRRPLKKLSGLFEGIEDFIAPPEDKEFE